MLDREKVIDSISRLDIFESLESRDIEILFDNCSEITLKPEEELFSLGSDTSSIYYIISGEIVIYYNRKIITRLGPGEYFGEIALVDNGPRSAAAKSGVETHLVMFPAETCRNLFGSKAGVWEGIAKTLCQRLRKTNSQNAGQYENFNMNVHDMRNFLSMLEFAQIVADELPDDDVNQEYLSYIITAKDNLLDMMNLTLKAMQDSTLKSGSASARTEVDIPALVKDCVAGLKTHRDIKRMVAVEVNVKNEIDSLKCNTLDIQRVLSNLIINAAQASADGSTVKVELTQQENIVEIKVVDEGCGMSPETMSHVFEQFFSTKQDGCGLGLASCKEIIEAHEGSLTCSSQLGVGSEFLCTLPIL